MICPICKNEIPDSIPFCPICGHEITENGDIDRKIEDDVAVESGNDQADEVVTEAVRSNNIKREENLKSPVEDTDTSNNDVSEDSSITSNKGGYENLSDDEKKRILNKVNGSGYTEAMYAAQKPIPGKLPERTYVKILKGFAALAGIFAVSLMALYFI